MSATSDRESSATDPPGPPTTVEFDFEPAAQRFRGAASAVTGDDLDRPTPCAGWTVRELLAHAASGPRFFAAIAHGDLSGVTAADIDTDGAWNGALADDLARLVEAWRDPTAWEGETTVGELTFANAQWARIGYDELVIHGWDLAAAVGQPYEPGTEELDVIEPFIVEATAGPAVEGLWGPSLDVEPASSRFERLLALSGRDPHWPPRLRA